MAEPFFRPRRIAFAGSSRLKASGSTAAFCHELGLYLGRHTADVLITAGFKRAPNATVDAGDWHFIEGVREALPDLSIRARRVETIRHDRDTRTVDGKYSVARFTEGAEIRFDHPINEARRFAMVDRADAVIAVKGSSSKGGRLGGTHQIALFALAGGKPVLPVPCFGGGVAQLWSDHTDYLAKQFALTSAMRQRWEETPETPDAARALAREMGGCFLKTLSRACFVIMPFADAQRPLFEKVISPAVEGVGDRIRRLDVLGLAGDVLEQIEQGIRTADYCIAVLDGLRPNVLYEIGMAHALGKPVVLLNSLDQIGDGAPFDIGHHQRIEFDAVDEALAKRVQKAIVDLHAGNFL